MSVVAYKKKCFCGEYTVWRSGKLCGGNIKSTWRACYSIEKGLSV